MKNFLAILFVALCVPTFSQDVEYQSPLGPPVPIPSVGTAKDTIVVSSTWFEMDCISFGLKEVVIHFDHVSPYQTSAHLVHNNDTVTLFHQGVLVTDEDTFVNDVIDGRFSMLERSIVLSEPPYNGVYAPVQNLGSFNSWMNPNGIWELIIVDTLVGYSGTLFSWSLIFGEDSLVCPTNNNYSDATRALSVCDNGFITSGGYDAGIYLDSIDLACVGEETASSWVNLEIEQSGSLSFIVHSATDYDFSIWQIDLNNTWSPPLRCSSVIDGGATGLDVNATVNADSLIFLPSLLVQANERYMLYLNNEGFSSGQYDGSEMPYWIEWTGDAELSCNGLSVQVQERHNDASYEIVAIGGGSVRVIVDGSAVVQISDLMGRLVVAPVLVSGVRLFDLHEGQTFVVSVNGVGRKLFVP